MSRSSGETEKKPSARGGREGTASVIASAVASGWDVAKDSLLPIVEESASRAGSYVAMRAPELVRDVVLPRFIAGFEKARRNARKRDDARAEEAND